jgi:hypothetical protein
MRIERFNTKFKELSDFRAITDFRNPVEVFTEHGKIKMNNLHTNKPQDAQSLINEVIWGKDKKSKPISLEIRNKAILGTNSLKRENRGKHNG